MKKFNAKLNLSINKEDDIEKITKVSKALSSRERINILRLLNNGPKNLNEISRDLKLPISTVAFHINILDEAQLILTEFSPTKKGHMKLCSRMITDYSVNIWQYTKESKISVRSFSMPIGMFIDASIEAPCGQASIEKSLMPHDSVEDFYNPSRSDAGILWFKEGFLTYRFPYSLKEKNVTSIEISLELCSEAAFYREDYPSDISFFLNNKYLGIYTSPGDHGEIVGELNPSWWPKYNTQYGDLLNIVINEKGIYFNGVKSNENLTIFDFKDSQNNFVELKLGVDENAIHKGGINLFGEGFGNYNQDIILKIHTLEDK